MSQINKFEYISSFLEDAVTFIGRNLFLRLISHSVNSEGRGREKEEKRCVCIRIQHRPKGMHALSETGEAEDHYQHCFVD